VIQITVLKKNFVTLFGPVSSLPALGQRTEDGTVNLASLVALAPTDRAE